MMTNTTPAAPSFRILWTEPNSAPFLCYDLDPEVFTLATAIEWAEGVVRDLADDGDVITVECGGIVLWAGAAS